MPPGSSARDLLADPDDEGAVDRVVGPHREVDVELDAAAQQDHGGGGERHRSESTHRAHEGTVDDGRVGRVAAWAGLRQTRAMTPLTLTEEQRSSGGSSASSPRTSSRRWPPTSTRAGEFDWETFKALVALELPALGMPAEYGGAGADLVTQAIAAEELARVDASASLMFLISKLGMLPVMNFGSEEMKQKYIPRIADRREPGVVRPLRGRRRLDVASMTTRADARRRRLRDHRHEGVDHQRRHQRPLHGVRQDRSGGRAPGDHAPSSSRPTGACR